MAQSTACIRMRIHHFGVWHVLLLNQILCSSNAIMFNLSKTEHQRVQDAEM